MALKISCAVLLLLTLVVIYRSNAQSNVGPGNFIYCGTTVACAGTVQSNGKIITGTAPLTTGTPSTAVLTGLPFTSATSYKCMAADTTTILNNIVASYTSGASATLTGPATLTDTVSYVCAGN